MLETTRCREAELCLEVMRLYLDNEASELQVDALLKHLDQCPQCLDLYRLEREIKKALQTRISRVSIPEKLFIDMKKQLHFL